MNDFELEMKKVLSENLQLNKIYINISEVLCFKKDDTYCVEITFNKKGGNDMLYKHFFNKKDIDDGELVQSELIEGLRNFLK